MNSAYEMYLDILHDVKALRRFSEAQQIQRSTWDYRIPRAVKKRLILQGYVRLTENVCYLTEDGLSVVGYKEIAA
jgi:hypothetical protein